jgi:DNA primase
MKRKGAPTFTSRIDFTELRRRVTIEEVLNLLRFQPTWRRGPTLRGPCPIHGSTSESTDHFAVDLDKNCFKCFHCGKGGNQLDLWTAVRRLPIHPAAIDLCRHLRIDVPWLR